jgi:hypothetical protein
MFKRRETELAGRKGVMNKCESLNGGSLPLVLEEKCKEIIRGFGSSGFFLSVSFLAPLKK